VFCAFDCSVSISVGAGVLAAARSFSGELMTDFLNRIKMLASNN